MKELYFREMDPGCPFLEAGRGCRMKTRAGWTDECAGARRCDRVEYDSCTLFMAGLLSRSTGLHTHGHLPFEDK